MTNVQTASSASSRRSQPVSAEAAYFAEEARCWTNAAIAYSKAAVASSNTYRLADENSESNGRS